MALIRKKDAEFGTFNNAYTRVIALSWRIKQNKVEISTETYLDKASRDANLKPLSTEVHTLSIPINGLTIAKVYTALKTLTDFTGAQDSI